MVRLRKATGRPGHITEKFPVTPQDPVSPSDPKAEPTRPEIEAQPETPAQQLARTRRYFRLTHRHERPRFAHGLDSAPDDFA